MMSQSTRTLAPALILLLVIASCTGKTDEPVVEQKPVEQQLPPLEPKPVPEFNADRAFADIVKQVSFGPRVPNTEPHRKQLIWMEEQLKATGATVSLQRFKEQGYGETLDLANVVASFNPTATDRVLLLAHWDSRPRADMEKDSSRIRQGVPAANDGASGVAVLMELARIMKDAPPPIGVDILFTDGEDYGDTSIDELNKYFLGAKHFVRTKPATYHPRLGILLDMVGGKDAVFKKEGYSMQAAPSVVNFVWNTARDLGLRTFRQEVDAGISDDHLPFIEAGMRVIDIIDAGLVGHNDTTRKYWHTLNDTPKNISTETLGEVGKLMLTLIYDRFPRSIRTL